VVYEAEDRQTGGKVALKLLNRNDPEAIYRFHQEFRRVSQVSHENLVQLMELEEFRGRHFLTMPLLEGAELLTALAATPPAEREAATRRLFRDVARGLQALHDAGLLHRDIKPGNIFATKEGRGILLDFGLAHSAAERTDERVQGTVAYMSPEQADSSENLGPISDWYGVGAVLYEALTGRPPFVGDQVLRVLMDKFQTTPPPVRELAPDAPADLAALADGLLAMEPVERPTVAEIRATLGLPPLEDGASPWAAAGGSLPRVLARRELLDELAEAVLGSERRPSVWLLSGDAGMGKTTVGEFLRARARETPHACYLDGRCGQGELLPFKGVEGVVDRLAEIVADLPAREQGALRHQYLDELLRVFPTLQRVKVLASVPRGVVESGLSAWEVRRRAAQALRHLLETVGSKRPLSVFLDDLHWIDRDGADLLALMLASGDEPLAATFVLAYRPDELAEVPWVDTLFEALGASELPLARRSLGPLAHAEATRIAEDLLPQAPPSRRERAVQAAQGNPRFLVELARDLAARSSLPDASSPDAAPSGPGAGGEEEGAGSVDLHTMLQRRVRELGPDASELLRLLALSEAPLSLDVLAAAAPGVENAALAAHKLRANHLARGGFGDHPARLDNEPIREAVRATIDPETTRTVHERLAPVLERAGAPAAQVAAHYRGAGDAAREAHFTVLAAEEAAQVLAFEHAASLYARAAALHAELGRDVYELHLRRAELLVSAQRGPDAARAFMEAAHAAPPERAALHQLHAAEQLLAAGHVERGQALLREALPVFHISLDSSPLRALVGVGAQRLLLWMRQRVQRSVLSLREERAIPESVLARVDALLALGRSMAMLDSTRAAAVNTRAAGLALKLREPRRARQALMLEVSFAAGTGSAKVPYARKQLDALRALNEAWPTREGPGLEAMSEGLVLALGEGDWAAARPHFARGREVLRKTPHGLEADVCENFELVAAATMGDFAWLHPLLLERLEDAERRNDVYQVVSLTCDGSHLSWLARDEPGELLRRVQHVMAGWTQERFLLPRYWELWARTRAALYRGDGPKALGRLDRGWGDIRRAGLLYSEAVRVDLWATRGVAALAQHAHGGLPKSAGLRIATKAARQLAKVRHPSGPLRGRLVRAGLLAVQGRPDEARAALDGLDAAFEAIRWRLHAAAAKLRLGQLVGGDQGAAQAAQARRSFRDLAVVDPDAMARVVAPEVVFAS